MLPVCRGYGKELGKSKALLPFCGKDACIPLAPHLFFPQFMDDVVPAERSLAMFMGMVLLGRCEQVWVFGSAISAGMAAEIEKAEKRDMVIRYFTENCKEVGLS